MIQPRVAQQSEWLKVMLGEIARKQEELECGRAEEALRQRAPTDAPAESAAAPARSSTRGKRR